MSTDTVVNGAEELPLFIAEYVVVKLSKRTLFGSPVRPAQKWDTAPERDRTFETRRSWVRTTFRIDRGSMYYAVELSACPELACMEIWTVGDPPTRAKVTSAHYGSELFKKMNWLYHRALNPREDSPKDSEMYFTLLNL